MSSQNNKQTSNWWWIILIIVLFVIVYFTSKEESEAQERTRELKKLFEEEEKEKNLKHLQNIEQRKEANRSQQTIILELINTKKELKQKADRKFKSVFFWARTLVILLIIMLNISYILITGGFRNFTLDLLITKLLTCNGGLFLILSGINLWFRGTIFSPQETLKSTRELIRQKIYGEYLMIDDEIKSHEEDYELLKKEMQKLGEEEDIIRGRLAE